MKNLTLVIHASAQQALADSLRALEQVQGFPHTPVEGPSGYSGADLFLSARDKVVGYVPRVRGDMLLADADVNLVLAALLSQQGFQGLGIYWGCLVEQLGRL